MKNLQELQNFLDQHEIPKSKKRPKTFLGIAKQPHYENVLSNMYAFFFRVKEIHGYRDLFIKSLLELIKESLIGDEKESVQNIENFKVTTEYLTAGGGRIDMLLQSDYHAIIIENKVHHHIKENDLDDYWDSVIIDGSSKCKIGVVLSLLPVPTSEYNHNKMASHYINITHLQLVTRIQRYIGIYTLDAQPKYHIFLIDFIQNIINMSTPMATFKEVDFYFKNQEHINDLISFKYRMRQHIIAEVEKANTMLGDFEFYAPRANSTNDKRARYFVSPRNKDLMFVVVFANLLDEKKDKSMHIAVELVGSALKDREQYRNIAFSKEENELAYCDNFRTTNYSWAHFAVKHYHPTKEQLTNLAQYISERIKEDHLLSIFHKLDNYLTSKK
ncbi:hypothetical protein BST92_10795 [Nonlabens arenilitoris]|uniref:PD-(D/E)XK nuclease superfamily protein n=1 Tax=Nonlabens arenilitoris TaxID=1217969 RepID=A0A2S7UDU3_9FLAO|nr:PD-(D/E)XK nuclease family protein [Nonlabens arenilitoris]PQJ32382.1 hypothetical protein BST92_10795 [Nonlabens arenilitoris]